MHNQHCAINSLFLQVIWDAAKDLQVQLTPEAFSGTATLYNVQIVMPCVSIFLMSVHTLYLYLQHCKTLHPILKAPNSTSTTKRS